MERVLLGIAITVMVMVLGIGMIAPASAAITHMLLQGCDTPTGPTVNCTIVWDTNSNGLCEASDMTINLAIKVEYVSLLEEKLSLCG